MKKLLMLLTLLLCLAPAMAEEPTFYVEGNYEYYLMTGNAGNSGGAVLTAYLPAPGNVGAEALTVLPAEIAGHPIVGYNFVFGEFTPDGKIIVQNGVTDFGLAFNWSYFSGEIVLPASLTHIEEGSLYGLLAEITVSEDNPYFTCEDGFLIDTRTETLLYVAPSAADKPLPAVRRLGDQCLDNWHAGETVVLPDTLTSIGSSVFNDLADTKHISIPAGVTEIGAGAFNCTGLTEVTLPAGLTAIEALTFSCNWFTEVIIPEGVERIESWAFYLCPLTRVEIPASCTFVAWDAFDPEVEVVLTSKATHLETMEEYTARNRRDESLDDEGATHTEGEWEYALTYGGAVITNWRWSWNEAPIPAVVELPAILGGEPVIGVADNALNTYTMPGKYSFTLVIPEGVQWLETGALTCCHNADSLLLPASLTWIPEDFSSHMFAEVTIASENPRYVVRDGYLIDTQSDTLLYTCPGAGALPIVRRYGSGALENFRMTTSWDENKPYPEVHFIIPEGVEVLGSFVFYDHLIDSVTLPESLRVIETSAFECMEIENGVIVVPAGVEVIQFGAFGLYTPTDAEIIVTNPDTRIETAEEYALRTGETWTLEDDWTPTGFTFAWE